jgi:folate-binding protein YgfZ
MTDACTQALRSGSAARVVERDVLAVAGAEAMGYLQGQCSQDLGPLAVGGSTEALLLSPQGKVDAYVRITRTGEASFVLDTDAGCGAAALARLERFRLRAKVTIEPLDWACLSLRGPGTGHRGPGGPPDTGGPELILAVNWSGWSGVDLLGPTPAADHDLTSWLPVGAVWCDQDSWEAARIEAGVPVGGREVTGSTIAAEVGLVERTISFNKGCFTGQELVARLDSRGSKVARRLCGVVVAGHDRPPVGAAVWTADGEHRVGELTSVAQRGGTDVTVALTTLHRRVVPPESVELRWEGPDGELHAAAEARSLPLAPDA